VFNEGRSINLSLHYLEQVIVALGEKGNGSRDHIPYRNSALTKVLRDSFGGNCITSLIATISLDVLHYRESVSTCRFAQRVGLVKNCATINRFSPPELQIEFLRHEVEALKEEVRVLRGSGEPEAHLTSEQLTVLKEAVFAYLQGSDDTPFVCGSVLKVFHYSTLALVESVDPICVEDCPRTVPVPKSTRINDITSARNSSGRTGTFTKYT
jgi:kinesin family protein 6/9